jgi:hypothetical protein
MITRNNILSAIENNDFSIAELVSIMELSAHKCGATSIKDMANRTGKSTQWIGRSNDYRKTYIGAQRVVISGISDDSLPF